MWARPKTPPAPQDLSQKGPQTGHKLRTSAVVFSVYPDLAASTAALCADKEVHQRWGDCGACNKARKGTPNFPSKTEAGLGFWA